MDEERHGSGGDRQRHEGRDQSNCYQKGCACSDTSGHASSSSRFRDGCRSARPGVDPSKAAADRYIGLAITRKNTPLQIVDEWVLRAPHRSPADRSCTAPKVSGGRPGGSVNEQLADLSSRFWEVALTNSPMWASLLGDHRFDAEVEDLSREHEDEVIEQLDAIVASARAIDPAALERDDRITRHVLVSEAEGISGSLRSRTAEFLVDPMLGLHMDIIQGVPQLRAATGEQAWAFVEKASKVGKPFDQAVERHRQGVANGRTPPRVAVEKVIGQLDAFGRIGMEQNPFLQIGLPDDWDDLQKARWKKAMEEQVTKVVNPAFDRYRDAVAADILPAARPPEKSGVCWLPDGEEIYRRAVKRYTSLDLDPREIHRIGLDEIAALEDEYRSLGGKVLGTNDVPVIYDRLRNDPALRFKTAEEVHRAAEGALARAREAIPDWFGRLPEAPCILQPVPHLRPPPPPP